MRDVFNSKFVAVSVAILIVAYVTITNFSIFEKIRGNSIMENVVEANALITPTPMLQKSSDFRPDGGFEFDSKPSKGFNEIVWLSMITGSPVGYGSGCAPLPCTSSTPRVEERVNWISQTPRGLLVTDNGTYPWKKESISVENFSFETETRKGQSYKFVGNFTSGGNYEEVKPKDAVLVGRLTKIADGKTVAEEEVSFNWFSWDEVDNETYLRAKPTPKKTGAK